MRRAPRPLPTYEPLFAILAWCLWREPEPLEVASVSLR